MKKKSIITAAALALAALAVFASCVGPIDAPEKTGGDQWSGWTRANPYANALAVNIGLGGNNGNSRAAGLARSVNTIAEAQIFADYVEVVLNRLIVDTSVGAGTKDDPNASTATLPSGATGYEWDDALTVTPESGTGSDPAAWTRAAGKIGETLYLEVTPGERYAVQVLVGNEATKTLLATAFAVTWEMKPNTINTVDMELHWIVPNFPNPPYNTPDYANHTFWEFYGGKQTNPPDPDDYEFVFPLQRDNKGVGYFYIKTADILQKKRDHNSDQNLQLDAHDTVSFRMRMGSEGNGSDTYQHDSTFVHSGLDALTLPIRQFTTREPGDRDDPYKTSTFTGFEQYAGSAVTEYELFHTSIVIEPDRSTGSTLPALGARIPVSGSGGVHPTVYEAADCPPGPQSTWTTFTRSGAGGSALGDPGYTGHRGYLPAGAGSDNVNVLAWDLGNMEKVTDIQAWAPALDKAAVTYEIPYNAFSVTNAFAAAKGFTRWKIRNGVDPARADQTNYNGSFFFLYVDTPPQFDQSGNLLGINVRFGN